MTEIEKLQEEIALRLSVSANRQHPEGIASLFLTRREIDAENCRYDKIMAEIKRLREKVVSYA